jgi:outer membrane protein insertion porin family
LGNGSAVGRAFAATLMLGVAGIAVSAPAFGQETASPPPPIAAGPTSGTIRQINVVGSQRLEPNTVRSYIDLKVGDAYDRDKLDQALKDLYATELFADVTIRNDDGVLTVNIRENPVINRIVLEGNKRLKDDKIRPEIRLAPRQIFTRSKTRADVARIVELYRRQGRFAANVEPKIVQLDQNRVDVVFEISEGPKSKVRAINIIGNEKFSDGELRGQMATKQTGLTKIFSSGTSYDPDRLAYDQQKLRQFYLTQGYADFRVASAIAELTPDRRDFIITYVVDEGARYKFGDVQIDSEIRDLKPETLQSLVQVKKGEWYNAQRVEDSVDSMTETAGLLGYAFADIRPQFDRDKDALTMTLTFKVAEAPRVYVERVDINGNTITQDRVIRREFRLAEGDAFNSVKVKRSRDRIQSLGYFQEKFEIEQKPGSTPDRIILEANLEERPTGELQVSAGFSSLESFIVDLSIRQRNFRGRGQELRAGVSYSRYTKSAELGFTEPYFLGKNIALGGDIFRRDFNSFNFIGRDRETTYEQSTTGFQIRAGVPLTEYWSFALRYGLSFEDVSLQRNNFYTDFDGNGVLDDGECDERLAGVYLCDAIGKRTTSSIGYSLIFDNLNNRLRPSRGHRFVFNQDFAGVGGGVRYVRTRAEATKYWGLGRSGFIFSAGVEGGYMHGLGQQVRLTDRFFLGEPQMRGFDIRGVGPRVLRYPLDSDGNPITERNQVRDDALGGNIYYRGRLELELPLGSGARELGLRPSIFADIGALWDTRYPFGAEGNPRTIDPTTRQRRDGSGNLLFAQRDANGNLTGTTTVNNNDPLLDQVPGYQENFLGDSPSPRVAVGIGVNWNSPFGPFRIDFAKVLKKQPGDDTKPFSFNVGTQF